MASAALPAREEVVWRAGKRPRAEIRRRPFEEVKWALLTKEQEMERRHVQEAIRRLDAIEELRKRARERKLDRDNRRIAFAALLERSTLMLQRCERGRQGRRVARRRVGATERIVKWMLAMVRRAAVKKAIRNRTILKMMLSAEALVEETLTEACFVLKNVVAIRAFQHRRFARMIQKMLRKRVALVRRSAAIIVRTARGWLARGVVRRARIRRSILKHRGSLSRRARGLSEIDPFALTAVSEKSGDAAWEGRWWDVGPSVAPRPRWGVQRMEREVERSRQRAASLGDLIRSGQEVAVRRGSGGAAAAAAAAVEDAGKRDIAHRQGSNPLEGSGSVRRATSTEVGFKKGASSQRAASMIDPREAEAAAWQDELSRRQARKEALTMVLDYKKLSLREKHLLRQREFDLEKQKRRLAAEKELQKHEQLKAREAMDRAKQRAREVEMLRRQEEESAQNRLDKIKSYMEEKAARELAERKAMAARERKERQAKEIANAKRQATNALFEKEKEERLERARRKRRAEEEEAKTTEAAAPRGRKGSTRQATVAAEKPVAATALNQRGKRAVPKNSGALDPITVDDREGRKRRRDRSHGVGGPVQGARRSRVAAGVRDGRLKPSQSAALPALPTVPPWKAMAGRGDKKRTRRRPPKREVERGKGGEGAVGDPKGVRKSGNSAANLKRVLIRSRSGGSAAADGLDRVDVRAPESGRGGAHSGAVTFDEGERRGTEEDKGSTEQGSLADGGFLTLGTLDSVFLPPGSGADSGGAEGLGATSAQGESSWQGWGSRSNRSSNSDETIGLCFSDTDTDRGEGIAVGGGVVDPSSVRFAHGADSCAMSGVAEEPSGVFVPDTPRVVYGHGQEREAHLRPCEREVEGKSCLIATDQSLAPSDAQGRSLKSDPVAAQSTLSPDDVSAVVVSGTFVEHSSDGILSAESTSFFSPERASHASRIRTESGEPHAGSPNRDACDSMEGSGGSDRDQDQSSNTAVTATPPLPLPTASTSRSIEGPILSRTGTASSAQSGHASSYHGGGGGDAAPASG